MGGRGLTSGTNTRQLTTEYMLKRAEVQSIQNIGELSRANQSHMEGMGIGSAAGKATSLYKKCACCKKFTLPFNSEGETCPKCGWIDDAFQNSHPNSEMGPNEKSLVETQREYFLNR